MSAFYRNALAYDYFANKKKALYRSKEPTKNDREVIVSRYLLRYLRLRYLRLRYPRLRLRRRRLQLLPD